MGPFWTGCLIPAVQQVDATDVVLAHLLGSAKDGAAVRISHHGGAVVVLGEGQSGTRQTQSYYFEFPLKQRSLHAHTKHLSLKPS